MRRICVFTGTRAEYGLLYWLLRELDAADDVELRLLVSGAHLAPAFGLTQRVIEADGFRIDAAVDMLLASDTAVGMAKSMGLGVIGFADALDRLRPDLLVVLGDRYEALAVASAAVLAQVPIAHVHGGELTEGAVDESIRHALTKLACLHFAAAEPFRRRILQMGEDPSRVHTVGAPGLDALLRAPLLSREELAQGLGVPLPSPLLLVTYHPVTLAEEGPDAALGALFAALDAFPEATVLITGPNADAGGRRIAAALSAFAAAAAAAAAGHRPGRVSVHTSLGQPRYLSALSHADVVIGNSSSGLIEAPAVGTPTVNLGTRQQGRLRAESVIDCDETAPAITAAVKRALSPSFRARLPGVRSPYGPHTEGGASCRIAQVLRSVDLEGIAVKRFRDLAVA